MKNSLLLFLNLFFGLVCVQAQTVILDFQTPATSAVFEYFGSPLNGQLTQVVNNPSATGINLSTKVSNYIKPVGAQTWAGAFTDLTPPTLVQTTGGLLIKIQIRMNHIGNLGLKLEGSTSGQPDWIRVLPNTQINQWQELVFDTRLPSIEAPNQAATGDYERVTVFFDFGAPGTGTPVTSHFDNLSVTPVLAATSTTTDVLCNGGNNGAITLNVTGGSNNYTYNWGGGVTTKNRSNLTAGTYTVTITDPTTVQTLTQSFTIDQPTAIVPTAASDNLSCFGENNGSITLNATGGTPNYTYNWGAGITGDTRTGLTAGTYTATVTDANNCTKTISTTISQPTALLATAVSTNIDCYANETGSITLTATGGTAGYDYIWDDGVTTKNRSALAAGTYTVTITDANNCTKEISQTIIAPEEALEAEVSVDNVDCFGNSTGAINLDVSGGTANYTYHWAGSSVTTKDRYDLPAGDYFVTITDANNCTTTVSESIYEPNEALSLAGTTTPEDCGNANGSINLSVSGGTAGFSFNWGNGITTQNRTGLSAGNYSVTVTDFNFCTATLSKTITASASTIAANATASSIACFGNATGTINVNVTTGNAPFSYNWGNGITTQNRTNLAAGTYTVTVADANNCTTTVSQTVSEPNAALSASAATTPEDCGSANGSINLTISGGTAGYSFNWENGSTTQNRTGLSAGNYAVTVTDGNNCTFTLNNTVSPSASTIAATTAVSNVACFGNATGTINLNVTLGAAPFSYNWGNGITTQNRSNLAAGVYTVTVTDALNCATTVSGIVSEPNAALLATAAVNAEDCGSANGSVNLTISGGTAGYSFNWEDGTTTQNLTGLSAGNYAVTVTDANNCTVSLNNTVSQSAATIAATASASNVACFGNATGAINLDITLGAAPYSFNWGNGITTQNRSDLAAGVYTVTVTDANNCATTVSQIISEPSTALSVSGSAVNEDCGSENGSINLAVIGGTSGYSFLWENGETTQNRSNLGSGNYAVTVTDANNCTAFLGQTITASGTTLTANADVNNIACFGNATGAINLTINSGTVPISYNWGNGITTQNRTDLAAGTYTVTLTDANNCTAILENTISEPAAFTCSASATDQTANNVNDGTATADPNGGTAAYTFLWSNGATSQTISNLAPGLYSVVATDANGCTSEQQVYVAVFGCDVQANISNQNVSCAGAADGEISVEMQSGNAPFTYLWSDGQTTATAVGLSAGAYNVVISDASGCEFIGGASIIEPSALLVEIVNQINTVCPNDASGEASAQIQGGTSPTTYLWSNGVTEATATDLLPGNYSLVITDVNGCTASASVNILSIDTAPPVLVCSNNITKCSDDNTVEYQSPVATDNCSTANGMFNILGGLPSGSVFPAGVTTQTFSFTDASGNVGTCSFDIEILSAAVVNTYELFGCFQNCEGSILASGIAGGSSPYTYQWSNGQTGTTISGLCDANTGLTVTDNAGCSTTQTININLPAALSLSTPIVVNDMNSQNSGSINITVQGGVMPYTFVWEKNNSPFATSEDISNLGNGQYSVTVSDANGCILNIENIEVTNIVGINEPDWAKTMKIQPNPTAGRVQILFPNVLSNEMEISIFDAQGRLVMQTLSNNEQAINLDLGALPEGIYLLKMLADREFGSRVLVVQR